MAATKLDDHSAVRLDKLLWFLRLAPSRVFAQQWVLAGHIRLNSRRIVKPAQLVVVGDVLTLPVRGEVKVLRLISLPHRRGPAAEAVACYALVTGGNESDSQGAGAA